LTDPVPKSILPKKTKPYLEGQGQVYILPYIVGRIICPGSLEIRTNSFPSASDTPRSRSKNVNGNGGFETFKIKMIRIDTLNGLGGWWHIRIMRP